LELVIGHSDFGGSTSQVNRILAVPSTSQFYIYAAPDYDSSMSRDYVLQPFQPAVNLQIDYAAELNEQQHAAVTAPPGASLVIAGAGSGKTRTLTYRVAFLLEQGIPPDRILLLTFSRRAAIDMTGRVNRITAAALGTGQMEFPWSGTFHAVGAHCYGNMPTE